MEKEIKGNCDYCEHKKYIGIYGRPCVTPKPCTPFIKANWISKNKN
jgi:hypothetical protein